MSKPMPLSFLLKQLATYLAQIQEKDHRLTATVIGGLIDDPASHERTAEMLAILLRPQARTQANKTAPAKAAQASRTGNNVYNLRGAA